jgi:dethiobiotin synthetase
MPLNNAKAFFVTATDTDAGKTMVTQSIIKNLQQINFTAVGCKPIACGFNKMGLNEDVQVYERINSIQLPENLINPLRFELPASPNIAAAMIDFQIQVKQLLKPLKEVLTLPIDFVFFEGIGGLKVPLSESETLIDLIRELQVPIILVIGLRVGCLNHALLTWETICREQLTVAGWFGNVVDPAIPALAEHVETLRHWISAPFFGTLPYQKSTSDQSFPTINVNPLLNYVN